MLSAHPKESRTTQSSDVEMQKISPKNIRLLVTRLHQLRAIILAPFNEKEKERFHAWLTLGAGEPFQERCLSFSNEFAAILAQYKAIEEYKAAVKEDFLLDPMLFLLRTSQGMVPIRLPAFFEIYPDIAIFLQNKFRSEETSYHFFLGVVQAYAEAKALVTIAPQEVLKPAALEIIDQEIVSPLSVKKSNQHPALLSLLAMAGEDEEKTVAPTPRRKK